MKMEKGWRQLRPDEVLRKKDEYLLHGRWHETINVGRKVSELGFIYRRRIEILSGESCIRKPTIPKRLTEVFIAELLKAKPLLPPNRWLELQVGFRAGWYAAMKRRRKRKMKGTK